MPHFEKMLYDQALLALAYLEAFQATGNAEYADTAREIFTYVLRDMTAPEGPFYSAEDADSEGVEGRFYVWSEREIRNALDAEDRGCGDAVVSGPSVRKLGGCNRAWRRGEQHTPPERGDRRSGCGDGTYARVTAYGTRTWRGNSFLLCAKNGSIPIRTTRY